MIGTKLPEWLDRLKPLVGVGAVASAVYVVAMFYYGGSPETWRVGYSPKQPVPFSHALHAGQLGMDCRYCHTTVEGAAFAAVPPSATCMNCHKQIAPDSRKLLAVRETFAQEAAGPLDQGARPAGLRVLQPQCPRDARRELCFVSWPRGSDGTGVHRQAAEHGVVPGLPSQSGTASSSPRVCDRSELGFGRRRN